MISVIIPLYNKEKTIKRAILSVIGQTYQNFEIIVIDDGSTDKSNEYANLVKDFRINIIYQENKGVSAARNRGVSEAGSQFVAFLDADDEWLPTYLEAILELHNEYPDCGVLATHYFSIYADSTEISPTIYPPYWKGEISNYYRDLLYFWPFIPSCVVIRKDILQKISGFPVGVIKGEDTNTWMRLALETRFAYYNEPLAIYHKENQYKFDMLNETSFHVHYNHADFLRSLLESDLRARKYKNEIYELIAKFDYPFIRNSIIEGNKTRAIQRLLLQKRVRFSRRKWWKLFMHAILPKFWLSQKVI